MIGSNGPQRGQVVRQPLVVGVQERDPGLGCVLDRGVPRSSGAAIDLVTDDISAGAHGSLGRLVGRAIVDDDHLGRWSWLLAQRRR